MSDSDQWARLREEQEKAIQETESKIKQLDKYIADYEALRDRLDTLPHEVTHDVMVPFGDLAFMPGKIYNTNEVLVLLGDNWFTETSAHHAAEIVGRRIEGVNEQKKKLKEQAGLLQPRREFTQELQQMAKDQQDMVDIKEDYDAEKEKKWKAQRRKQSPTVSTDTAQKQREAMQAKARQISQQLKESPPSSQAPPLDEEHEQKMKRLDELLMQERRERQLTSSNAKDETLPVPTNYPPHTGKTVRWKDNQGAEDDWCTDDDDDDEDDDESDDYEEEDDDEEESYEQRLPRVLKVKFTKVDETDKTDTKDSKDIVSPADIYRLFVEPNLSKPRSILKRTSSTEEPGISVESQQRIAEVDKITASESLGQGDSDYKVSPPSQPHVAAFGDTVKEKITTNQMVASLCASLDDIDVSGKKKPSAKTSATSAGKKVSKFKQRQMQAKK